MLASSAACVTSSLWERRRGKRPDLLVDGPGAAASNGYRPVGDNPLSPCTLTPVHTPAPDVTNAAASLLDAYDMLETVGKGSFSIVYRAIRRNDGEQVALKVMMTADEEVVEIAMNEFSLMKRLDHPNIVRAYDLIMTADRTVLALEFFLGDVLSVAVAQARKKRLKEASAQGLFIQLLRALDYLHRHRILHRDVKPENVMVSRDLCDLKLVDFNIAKSLSDGMSMSPKCTPGYAAPEIRKGGSPCEAGDVWGAGVCLHYMLSGKLPVLTDCDHVALHASIHMKCTQPCKAVLAQCLEVEHSMRPAPMTLLQIAWVRCGPSASPDRKKVLLRATSGISGNTVGSQETRCSQESTESRASESTWTIASSLETVESRRSRRSPGRRRRSSSCSVSEEKALDESFAAAVIKHSQSTASMEVGTPRTTYTTDSSPTRIHSSAFDDANYTTV